MRFGENNDLAAKPTATGNERASLAEDFQDNLVHFFPVTLYWHDAQKDCQQYSVQIKS